MITDALSAELFSLEGFDVQFRSMVESAHRIGDQAPSDRRAELTRRADKIAREKRNLTAALREFGPSQTLREELAAIEAAEVELARDQRLTERSDTRPLLLPASVAELRGQFAAAFTDRTTDSPEFAKLLRPMIASFHVRLLRLCDGGHLLPQARVGLALSGIAPDLISVPDPSGLLKKEVTLNLFGALSASRFGAKPSASRPPATISGRSPGSSTLRKRPCRAALRLDRLMTDSVLPVLTSW